MTAARSAAALFVITLFFTGIYFTACLQTSLLCDSALRLSFDIAAAEEWKAHRWQEHVDPALEAALALCLVCGVAVPHPPRTLTPLHTLLASLL